MSLRSVIAVGFLLSPSCGGQSQPASDAGAGSAQTDACRILRVPKEHRAVAQTCPVERGNSGPLDTAACTNRAGITCATDADCVTGKNGRCFTNGDPCQTICSYDQCLTDADCAAGPCVCRSAGADLTPNDCAPGGNCRTDADCGECGYCSPSVVPNSSVNCTIAGICPCIGGVATLTYNCRTASDECSERDDCMASEMYCGYDAAAGHWACAFCQGVPHL